MTSRPNILCIVSEDCPPRLGAYGDPVARTPNLDRLAGQGVVFENAFSTSPVCAPSRFAMLTGHHAEAVGPAQHMTALGRLPAHMRTYPELMREAGYYCTNNWKTHYNCDADPARIWDESSPHAHWRNRSGKQPFLAVFNCMETHESCIFAPIDGPVKPEDVTVPLHLPDIAEMRDGLARYYNHVEIMDRYMGERLAELDAAGLGDDTIVIYYSDHGSPLPRSKRFCYDDGVKVPLIVRVPEKWRHLAPGEPGSRRSEPVSMVDLLATFLSVSGAAAAEVTHGQAFLGQQRRSRTHAFSGRDRMDEHYDMMRTVRSERYRYIRNYAPHRIYGQHYAFAWNAQTYQAYERLHLEGRLDAVQARFWQQKPAEELYDLALDPDELVNLVGSPSHAGIAAEMRQALDAHMLAVRDNGFIPEGAAAEGYEASRGTTDYPLEAVMRLAAKAIQRDRSHLGAFMAALAERNAILRFWGAQGILMLATKTRIDVDLLGALENEGDGHVRIVLAEAAGHKGQVDTAVTLLTDIVSRAANARLRLQAIDALTYLPLRPQLSLAAITVAANDDDEYIRGSAEYLRLLLRNEYRPDSPVFNYERFNAASHMGMARTPQAPHV